MRSFFSFCVCASLLCACGDGATTPNDAGAPAADASSDRGARDVDVAEVTPDDGSIVCATVANGGPIVDMTNQTSPAPQPNGGNISDGLYYLTAVNDYDGATGTVTLDVRASVQISGATMQIDDSGLTATATFVTDGTTITLVESCPTNATSTDQYSATSTTFSLYSSDLDGNTLESVYTRQ
jgi:hypothetical protein